MLNQNIKLSTPIFGLPMMRHVTISSFSVFLDRDILIEVKP